MHINIKLKKTHPDAVLPAANNSQTSTGDTGYDLTAVETVRVPSFGSAIIPVGLTLADITPGYWVRIEPRSGLGFKHSIQPHLGVIDNGYRGDLGVKLYNFHDDHYTVNAGDKIAQLVIYKLLQTTFEFVDSVTDTARGDKGFGSSDKSDNTLTRPPFKISQINDDYNYANYYKDGNKYIPNPMKIDQSDPDYIPDPEDTHTATDNTVTYE